MGGQPWLPDKVFKGLESQILGSKLERSDTIRSPDSSEDEDEDDEKLDGEDEEGVQQAKACSFGESSKGCTFGTTMGFVRFS